MTYKVVHRVEINGKTREIDSIVDESEFKAPVPLDKGKMLIGDEKADVGELASLLATGHIVKVEE